MINEFMQEQASLYAAGAMTAQEREKFELVLEFDSELRELVDRLMETSSAIMLAGTPAPDVAPSAKLKARLLDLILDHPQHLIPDAVVAAGPDGLVRWVSPAFTAMCGYTLDELRGKKLGPILQGTRTDPETAAKIRCAVRECRACCETILNYHKDGRPYWVEVAITPFLNESDKPVLLMARERELTDRDPW